MVKDEGVIEEEVEQLDLQVKLLLKDQIDPPHEGEILELFKAGYGDQWLGDDVFRNVRMVNCTRVLELYSNSHLAGAILFDYNRISQVAVHPDFRGQGLGVKLFQAAARANPGSWISVSVEAEPMLTTITDSKLNFLPVEDQDQIEALLRETNGSRDSFQVDIKEIEMPLLSQQLIKKGIIKQEFTAYAARAGSTHGQGYYQILFQSRPV